MEQGKNMRKMKVWGGLTFKDGSQVRTIVATTTKKKAMELLEVRSHEFNNYWCEAGNHIELTIALAEPNTVFIAVDRLGKWFVKA